MPRGRHRHSPPLHRLLPPSAVAGVSVFCAGTAWLISQTLLLRILATVAMAAAVVGAVLMRLWDREAGLQVAELNRARAGDEWRTEERLAELETELEEARELRVRSEGKLRAKRVELANLRGEHAALLRRYATAETERATALEKRRLLALEAAKDADDGTTESPAVPVAATSYPAPEVYEQAAAALAHLTRNAAAQQVRAVVDQARRRDLAERAADTEGAEEPKGKHAATGREHPADPAATPAPASVGQAAISTATATAISTAATATSTATAATSAAATASTATAVTTTVAATTTHETLAVPIAATMIAAPVRPVSRPIGGFDFFGTQKSDKSTAPTPAALEALESVQNEDLADVVGPEALAAHKAESDATEFKPASTTRAPAGQVIDLTVHDETERLNLTGLRSAL